MFMGPLEATKPWSMEGVQGIYRFLGRVWRLYCDEDGKLLVSADVTGSGTPSRSAAVDPRLLKVLHQTIKKVGEDTEALAFNTAISQMMIFVNELTAQESRPRVLLEPFVLVLAPYAPHLAEELWAKLGHAKSLTYEPFPAYDASLLIESTVQIVVQVNGKVRARLDIPAGLAKDELEKQALAHPEVQTFLAGKQVRKVITVPGKLVNIAVG
jgi:leucyl-tRNA synthetase